MMATDGRTALSRSTVPDEASLELYLDEIGRYPLLSREQEFELATSARNGDEEALDLLVRSNLRFVVSVAKRYRHQGVGLSDLINEGNLGLLRAARRFEPERGIKFISYAVWWIRQSILEALAEQGRLVRLPANRASALHQMARSAARLRQELGREPTAAELAADGGIPLAEVEQSLTLLRSHLSLDAPVADGDHHRLLDCLSDPAARGPEAEAMDSALADSLERCLAGLREREARVLRMYFGLDAPEARTLEQIGAALGITRERVRQIKDRALKRLRVAGEPEGLASYLG